MGKKYQTHRFFCIKCGKEGIPLPRKSGHKHARFHKKKLYCPYCKMEINHVECQTDEDVYNFRIDFEDGVYADEVEKSMAIIRNPR
jgi:hypothetical protein